MQPIRNSPPEPAIRPSPNQASARSGATLGSPFQSPIGTKTTRRTVEGNGEDMSVSPNGSNSSPSDTPSKRARRSISMNFSSPTSWMSKTGSIRRPKRSNEYPPNASLTGSLRMNKKLAAAAAAPTVSSTGKRHVSAPLSGSRPSSAQAHYQPFQTRSVTTPADLHLRKPVEGVFKQPYSSGAIEREQVVARSSSPIQPTYVEARAIPKRQRNSSSPLPPLSRLSSFNIDLTRLGASPSASGQLAANVSSTAAHKENHAPVHPGFATLPRSFPLVPRHRDVSDERSSTLVGSDLELRGFASSGDDDDTDFKSDTIFDSVRTAASTRLRSTDTPIESMFDESPPSTAGNGKAKRLSIQEILGQAWDSDTRIMEEEDEGFSTPMRTIPVMQERSLTPASVMRHFDEDYEHEEDRRNFVDTEANSILAPTTADTDRDVSFSSAHDVDFSRPSIDDDDDDDWARTDDSGVTNHLSPPSRSLHNSFHEMGGLMFGNGSGLGAPRHQRPALGLISGNGGLDPSDQHDGFMAGGRERPRSTLFDWSESTVHLDKIDSDGHSPRPKTVHGKQELDLRNGRPANRKGPAVAHVRSQSVPVNADPVTEGTKPATSKFGTWASSGPKNASEDWDDDFDFGTNHGDDEVDENDFSGFDVEEENAFGQSSTLRSSKGPSSSFAMIVPASIQATQPTVKAHSGQIRELSLLVNGLKRLCRHARDLNIVDESPALWKEAENIIALASPDEDLSETTAAKTTKTAAATSSTPSSAKAAAIENDSDVPRASIEFDVSDVEDQFLSGGFDSEARNSFDDDPFDTSDFAQAPSTPPPPEMSRTAVVRERPNTRRRSVFSPDDDIFGGGWPQAEDKAHSPVRHEAKEALRRPQTPNRFTTTNETPDSAMIESIMEAMQQQRSASAPIRKSPVKQSSTSELFFNTNTLQELVKRANTLFHTLSDLVRRAELFTQSPAVTPRHDRLNRCEDGSPAFTRVFTDPSSPSKRLPKSHSGNSVARGSPALESPSTNRVSQRLQMMTVS
ncbi:hypothetical protein SBRCBS47491_005755 [Sporothrix bragantina]|uniref:Uncharacterized protein n=1 Tax=Sporothrix bragantina TaxID=671064 RepID=A0ABP0BZ90_9PEZI